MLNVEGLQKGLYRYLPVEHQLIFEHADPDLNRNFTGVSYNRHEADLNCVTVPLNKHRKSICNFVRSELFLIKEIPPGI